jgi:hypothetical protein
MVAGSTSNSLVLRGISTNNAGAYTVVVSGPGGSVTSTPPATVTVLEVTNIATALAAYWTFDEPNGTTVADVTGKGNDGTMFNFLGDGSERGPGRIGGSLHFRGPGPGLNDYVQVTANNIQPATTMTISGWVWADSILPWASILKNWPTISSNQVHFGLYAADGDLSNELGLRPYGVQFIGPVREGAGRLLPVNAWVHVALVLNGETMQLYRNGTPVGAPLAYNGVINTNTLSNTLCMGAKLDGTGLPNALFPSYWQGKMDDMGFWTRGLTPAEILSIYVAGQAGQPLTNAGAYGSVTLPLITSQPRGVTRYAGEYNAQFSVLAVGGGALSYQWRENGLNVQDATNNILTLPGPFASSASYSVAVTDAGNGLSVTSAPAALTILGVSDIAAGLVGHWTFDETHGTTAGDATANARAATLYGYYDDSMWGPGQIGGALAFGGPSYGQYAGVANFVQPTNGTLTLSAWVWVDAANGADSISDNYGQSGIGQFRFGLDSATTPRLTGGIVAQGGAYVAVTNTTGFPGGSWQHVALVANGATVCLYSNGTLVATRVYNGTILGPSPILNFFIGARIADDGVSLNTVPGYLTGKLDDLGMWTRGLTPLEILGIYTAGCAGVDLSQAQQYIFTSPHISVPPASQTVTAGDDVTFSVTALGISPMSYQWCEGGAVIAGATNTSYSLRSVVASDAGAYTVIITNVAGSVTSAPSATLVVNALALPPMTDSLVGYWKFDEVTGTTALDSAGGNHGVLKNYPGGSAQWVPGIIGRALQFGGSPTSQYVYVADYPKASSTITVAAWVWADNIAALASIAKNWGNTTPVHGQFLFGLYVAGDLSIGITEAGGTVRLAQEGVLFPTGSWQHVAFTCDGAYARVYRNGQQVASVRYDGTLISPLVNCLGIGAMLDEACSGGTDAIYPGFWQGKMDDEGLWTRSLSPVEIQMLYNSGLSGRGIEAATLSPMLQVQLVGANLVFSWPELPLGRGFTLESTVSVPASSWAPVGGSMTVSNGLCSVSVPAASTTNQFFRLHQ